MKATDEITIEMIYSILLLQLKWNKGGALSAYNNE